MSVTRYFPRRRWHRHVQFRGRDAGLKHRVDASHRRVSPRSRLRQGCDSGGSLPNSSTIRASRNLRFYTAFYDKLDHAADYILPGAGMVLAILGADLDSGGISGWEPYEAECFHRRYNPLEPGNRYCPGASGSGVFPPEWHSGEDFGYYSFQQLSRPLPHRGLAERLHPGSVGLVPARNRAFNIRTATRSAGRLRDCLSGSPSLAAVSLSEHC